MVEVSHILSGLADLIPANHCPEEISNVRAPLLQITLNVVDNWLKVIRNPNESSQSRRFAVETLNRASSNKMSATLMIDALNRLNAAPAVMSVATEMEDQHAITGALWMISQLRGAAGVIAYLHQESRAVGRSCAFWILGYPEVICTISLSDCVQVLHSVCNYDAGDTEELFRIVRLIGSCMLPMMDRSIPAATALEVLKFLDRILVESSKANEFWKTWIWTLSCLSQKSDILRSEQWKAEFTTLRFEEVLLTCFLDDEEIAEYTALAILHGRDPMALFEKIQMWFQAFPQTSQIVATGIKTLGNSDLCPRIRYSLLSSILPKTHATEQFKLEKQMVISASLQLASQCAEDAALKDDPVIHDVFHLLLEALQVTTERQNTAGCVDGLVKIISRKPNLAQNMRPLIADGRFQNICLRFVNDSWVLPLCLQLAFALDDFEQIMRLLDITRHNPRALQLGLKTLQVSLEDHSTNWDSYKICALGNFAKERLADLRMADTQPISQCLCLHILVTAYEKEPSLLDVPTICIIFNTFTDVWDNPLCGTEVLGGVNKFLLSISPKQRKEELPKVEHADIFVVSVKRAFRKFVCNTEYKEYEEQLCLVLLLLEGVEACFGSITDSHWGSISSAFSAVDTFVRSTQCTDVDECRELRSFLLTWIAQWPSDFDCELHQRCTILLGLLGKP